MSDAPGRLLDDAGDIDLWVLMGRLWAGRRWLLVSIVAFGAAFAAAAFLMTPLYRANAVFVDASTDRSGMGGLGSSLGQLGGLASLAGISVGSGNSKLEEALAVLRSRELTEAFIREEGLMQELLYQRWDAEAGQWRGREDRWPTLNDAFKVFDGRVRVVNRDTRTGLVTLQILWKSPELAATWANQLIARVNAEMRARAIADTTASVGYLEKELAATSVVETREAITRLMEAQINQRMLANVTNEYAFRVVDRALPPDPRDQVQPRKLVLLALGPLVGFVFGALCVLVAGAWVARRR